MTESRVCRGDQERSCELCLRWCSFPPPVPLARSAIKLSRRLLLSRVLGALNEPLPCSLRGFCGGVLGGRALSRFGGIVDSPCTPDFLRGRSILAIAIRDGNVYIGAIGLMTVETIASSVSLRFTRWEGDASCDRKLCAVRPAQHCHCCARCEPKTRSRWIYRLCRQSPSYAEETRPSVGPARAGWWQGGAKERR